MATGTPLPDTSAPTIAAIARATAMGCRKAKDAVRLIGRLMEDRLALLELAAPHQAQPVQETRPLLLELLVEIPGRLRQGVEGPLQRLWLHPDRHLRRRLPPGGVGGGDAEPRAVGRDQGGGGPQAGGGIGARQTARIPAHRRPRQDDDLAAGEDGGGVCDEVRRRQGVVLGREAPVELEFGQVEKA